jgi:regulatory protein
MPTGSRTALDRALEALRHRDRSEAELARRLAEQGFDEDERRDALATLRRTGLLDDRRYAESRAASLAGRGAGDALIRHDLDTAGISGEDAESALACLTPEPERARGIVERRGPGAKTGRYLSAKGFAEDTVRSVLEASSSPLRGP